MSASNTTVDATYFAAIDLGSNSFHLLIARFDSGILETVDREKDMVQLAEGLQKDGNLSKPARERALACLARFAERIRDIPSHQVRAVGTKTLRDADAAGDFLVAAERALGQPIMIISGYEEARLVYSGLSHSVTNDNNQRLVIDIGGASTEFIIGCDDQPELLESLNFGCVAITRDYFHKGIHRASIHRAYMAVCQQLEMIRATYIRHGWDISYGTSGTARAIAELLGDGQDNPVITAEGLNTLIVQLERDGEIKDGDFSKPRRKVLPAGIVILKAIFDELELETLHVANATLKEGLIYDTIGRLSDDDIRLIATRKLQDQFRVDQKHADRTAHLALHLWRQINGPEIPGASRTKLLSWAAQLHEVGLGISHSSYHHHGFYILQHSDIAGFGRYEQSLLAHLVGCHRKKIAGKLRRLDIQSQAALLPLLVCLRLSVILNRGREGIDTHVALKWQGNEVTLSFSEGWLVEQPLTQAGLEKERQYLSAVDITLTIKDVIEDVLQS